MTRLNPIRTGKMMVTVTALLVFGLASAGLLAHGGQDHVHGPAMNFHAIDDRLMTGGQFETGGLENLAAGGLEVVIDLRETPPAGQQEKLAAQGVEWVSVPVAFGNPTAADFDAFAAAMKAHEGKQILVQCQANFAASAMTFLYRVNEGGVSARKARKDLEAVWRPEGTWGDYVDSMLD